MRRLLLVVLALLMPVGMSGSGATAAGPRVTVDPVLTGLFNAYGDAGKNDRWTGSDSAISIPLPDGRFLWTGGDTFLGTVNKDHSRAQQGFIHNCYVVQQRDGSLGPTLYTHGGGLFGSDRAKFLTTDDATWYWPGDAFVEGGKLRQFLIRIAGAAVTFSVVSTEIATLSLPGLAVEKIGLSPGAYLPAATGGQVFYGEAVVPEKTYTYIYGVEGFAFGKYLHVARARTGHVMDGGWEYWSGSGWTTVAAQSARLTSGVGDEMSVVKTKHGYRAIASENGIGANVLMWTAPRPEGPWSNPRVLYRTPESNSATITYNAKEHPEHHGRDWISVSYNVNAQSSNSNGLYSDVRNYRPRFIRVYIPPDL